MAEQQQLSDVYLTEIVSLGDLVQDTEDLWRFQQESIDALRAKNEIAGEGYSIARRKRRANEIRHLIFVMSKHLNVPEEEFLKPLDAFTQNPTLKRLERLHLRFLKIAKDCGLPSNLSDGRGVQTAEGTH